MAGQRTTLRRRAADLRVGDLPTTVDAAVVALLTERFLDDPIWRAIGPAPPAWRRAMLRSFHRAELANARRWGGVVLGVRGDDGLAGVQVAYPPGAFPLPKRALASAVPSMLLAGPGPALRAFAVNLALERLHPRSPHVYARLLAADPRRPGAGRVLTRALVELAQRSGVPVYGETMREDTVRFLRALGFRVWSQRPLVRRTPWWSFEWPAQAVAR
ncbi:MAG TPA: hypothetical protein VFV85_01290 [Conexibacter sp.]|nr:hypothetical protein [Conexibacter sp.]